MEIYLQARQLQGQNGGSVRTQFLLDFQPLVENFWKQLPLDPQNVQRQLPLLDVQRLLSLDPQQQLKVIQRAIRRPTLPMLKHSVREQFYPTRRFRYESKHCSFLLRQSLILVLFHPKLGLLTPLGTFLHHLRRGLGLLLLVRIVRSEVGALALLLVRIL